MKKICSLKNCCYLSLLPKNSPWLRYEKPDKSICNLLRKMLHFSQIMLPICDILSRMWFFGTYLVELQAWLNANETKWVENLTKNREEVNDSNHFYSLNISEFTNPIYILYITPIYADTPYLIRFRRILFMFAFYLRISRLI